jgi:hypothetical protein
MIPISIEIGADGNLTVQLRHADSVAEQEGEAIIDVNRDERWIHGLELIGGFCDFNLARAVKPFHPDPPRLGQTAGVTYDQEADAAYIYFSIKQPAFPSIPSPERRYAISITPTARFGLDNEGGLVWVKFSIEKLKIGVEEFVSLIDAPVLKTESS